MEQRSPMLISMLSAEGDQVFYCLPPQLQAPAGLSTVYQHQRKPEHQPDVAQQVLRCVQQQCSLASPVADKPGQHQLIEQKPPPTKQQQQQLHQMLTKPAPQNILPGGVALPITGASQPHHVYVHNKRQEMTTSGAVQFLSTSSMLLPGGMGLASGSDLQQQSIIPDGGMGIYKSTELIMDKSPARISQSEFSSATRGRLPAAPNSIPEGPVSAKFGPIEHAVYQQALMQKKKRTKRLAQLHRERMTSTTRRRTDWSRTSNMLQAVDQRSGCPTPLSTTTTHKPASAPLMTSSLSRDVIETPAADLTPQQPAPYSRSPLTSSSSPATARFHPYVRAASAHDVAVTSPCAASRDATCAATACGATLPHATLPPAASKWAVRNVSVAESGHFRFKTAPGRDGADCDEPGADGDASGEKVADQKRDDDASPAVDRLTLSSTAPSCGSDPESEKPTANRSPVQKECVLPDPLPHYITKMGKPVPRVLKESLHCTVCDIYVNSDNQMKQHVNSLRHKNTLEGIPTPPKPGREERAAKPKAEQYRCNICKVTLNSDIQLAQHLTSQRHINMMEGKPPKPRWTPYDKTLHTMLRSTTLTMTSQLKQGNVIMMPTAQIAQPAAGGAATGHYAALNSKMGHLLGSQFLSGGQHLSNLMGDAGGVLQARELVYIASPQPAFQSLPPAGLLQHQPIQLQSPPLLTTAPTLLGAGWPFAPSELQLTT